MALTTHWDNKIGTLDTSAMHFSAVDRFRSKIDI